MENSTQIQSPWGIVNAMRYVGQALWNPEELWHYITVLKDPNLGEAERTTQARSFHRSSRWLFLLTLVLFGSYMYYFGYSAGIVHLAGNSSFYPINGFLNWLIFVIIMGVFFLLWRGLDYLTLRSGGPFSPVFRQDFGSIHRLSLVPFLILPGILVVIRMAFRSHYIIWGLWYIPMITVIIAVGWHYFLLYYFSSGMLVTTEQPQRLRIALIVLIGEAVVCIVLLFWLAPYAFNSQPIIFLEEAF